MASISHPGYIAVGPDQHGSRSRDGSDDRKLQYAGILGVDPPNPVRPWRDVEAVGLAEVEQDRPSAVQQRDEPQRAVGGDQVEIRHAASEQGVPVAKVVMNVEA